MRFRLAATAIAITLAYGTARAAYYVDDETPAQTALATRAAPAPKAPDDLTVPFFLGRATLGPLGRRAVAALIQQAKTAQTVVVSGYNDDSNQPDLAMKRAHAIQAALIAAGVDANKIHVTSEQAIMPGATAKTYNSTVTMLYAAPAPSVRSPVAQSAVQSAQLAQPTAAPASYSPAPSESADVLKPDPVKLAIARKLARLGNSKVINAEDTLALLAEFLRDHPAEAAAMQAYAQTTVANGGPVIQLAPTPVAPAPTPQFVPVQEPSKTWTLAANNTLRDQLTEWAADAKWSISWEASNPYQITFGSTMRGTFLEVLSQVAKALPNVDFKVSKSNKSIRVVDAGR